MRQVISYTQERSSWRHRVSGSAIALLVILGSSTPTCNLSANEIKRSESGNPLELVTGGLLDSLGWDGGAREWFGASLAVSQDAVVVGLPGDSAGGPENAGSVYLMRPGLLGRPFAKLIPSTQRKHARFGTSVAARSLPFPQPIAIAGAPGDGCGAVYVFESGQEVWSQKARIVSTSLPCDAEFGTSLALFEDTLVVGSKGKGAVVFTQSGDTWTEQGVLLPDDGWTNSGFGRQVAVYGDMVVVGAVIATDGGPARDTAVVYDRRNGVWSRTALASMPAAGSRPAEAVPSVPVAAVNWHKIVVGSPYATVDGKTSAGQVGVFDRVMTDQWSSPQIVLSPQPAANARFGASVLMKVDDVRRLYAADQPQQGDLAHVTGFEYFSDRWTAIGTVEHANVRGEFTIPMDVSRDLFVGVPTFDDDFEEQGAVIQYLLPLFDGRTGDAIAVGGGGRASVGMSISADGETALVGAPSYAGVGAQIYLKRYWGGWWPGRASSPGDPDTGAGESVAIDGRVAVAGRPGSGSGSVEVSRFEQQMWLQDAILTAPDLPYKGFGESVSASGSRIVVGARSDDTFQQPGAAIVYERENSTWIRKAVLTPASPGAGGFGRYVDIQGNTIVVGAPRDTLGGNTPRGAAYVFALVNGTWTQRARLTDMDGQPGDRFGEMVQIDEGRIIVGSPGSLERRGKAYVFTKSNGSWNRTAELVAPDGIAGDEFGSAVAIDGPAVLVGAPMAAVDGLARAGVAHSFSHGVDGWQWRERLVAPIINARAQFGRAVAISGSYVLIGAPYASTPPPYGTSKGGAVFAGSWEVLSDGTQAKR
ncbi:FG-GAP repeat protein [Tahibacter amnicola]|uniref:FG-GAP repeat protein n=1 Tax=Tahibacter amnicola TaxID=2976241 RepID=A0ABY6BC30_9GAMM|nr:FG-GAP repeat protein [Tahibacter amnicola]UXI65875.1 FG-GAP repeat protein [Tahibacter amnicola]